MADEAQAPAQAVDVNTEAPSQSDAPVVAPTTTDSSPEENNDAPAEESSDEQNEEAASADNPADTADESQPTEEETAKKKGAEARNEQLNKEIRERVARKNELKREIADLEMRKYRTESVAELVANGMDAQTAEIEAQRQEMALQQHAAQVADLNNTFDEQVSYVQRDYPMFDPSSPLYDANLHRQANEVYERVAGVQMDETGMLTNLNVMPYDIYKAFAESADHAAKQASIQSEIKAQKNAERMAAAVEPTPSTGLRQTKSFESMNASEKREYLRAKGHDI